MKRRAIFAGLFACAWLASPASARAGTKRALIVGINTYEVAGAPKSGRKVTNLRGAEPDARLIYAILTQRFGFEEKNVTLLVSAEATRAAILAAIDRLAKSAAGDEVVFYYAGHGSQQPNSLSDEEDAWRMTLKESVLLTSQQGLDFQPGTKWQYSNGGLNSLGRIIKVDFGRNRHQLGRQPLTLDGRRDPHYGLTGTGV